MSPGDASRALPPSSDAQLARQVLVDVCLALAIALGTLFGAAWAWQRLRPDAGAVESVVFLLTVNAAGLGLAALATLARRPPARGQVLDALRRARTPALWACVAAVAVTTFLLTHAALLAGNALGIQAMPGNNPLLNQLVGEHLLLLAVFVLVVAPVVEETLFRRVLFGRFLAAGRAWPGAVVSGLAFALAHEPWRSDLLQWLLLVGVYTVMGMLLCGLYRRTGSLVAPVAAHALHNALTLALLLAVTGGGQAPLPI